MNHTTCSFGKPIKTGFSLFLLLVMMASSFAVQAAAPASPSSAGTARQADAPSGDFTWLEKAPMPIPVSSFGFTVLNDQIYVIGGHTDAGDITAVQRYTSATDSWEVDTAHGGSLSPLPQSRSFGFFCEVLSGKIHCMGGWQDGSYKGEHFIYDPAVNTWSTGPSLPQYPIGQFATTFDNAIYVFGGWWGSYWNTVYKYSDATGWSTMAPMPTPRNHAAAAVYNGKIYAIGGEGAGSSLDVVEMYDPAANTWTSGLAPLPWQQSYIGWSGIPTLNGIIYIAAGTHVAGYDPQENSWQTLNPLPVSAGGSTVTVGGSLYVIGTQNTLQGVAQATALVANLNTNGEIYPGDLVSANLTIQNANGLYAAQSTCLVDPAVLQPQGAVFGDFFDPTLRLVAANQADAAAGKWLGAISQQNPADPLSGNGLFATISYVATAPGTTSLTCEPLFSDRNGFAQPVVYVGVNVTVLAFATISGTVNYQGRLSHNGIDIMATGPVTRTAATDGAGNFVIDGLKAGSYDIVADAPRYLPACTTANVTSGQTLALPNAFLQGGDANDDGVINIGDATLVAANFGLNVPPADERADINADSIINIQDLAILGGNYELSGCQGW